MELRSGQLSSYVVCVVVFNALSSFKGNSGYSAGVDLVQSVKESSENCVCCGTMWQLCLFKIM